jgi:hypothetical protein
MNSFDYADRVISCVDLLGFKRLVKERTAEDIRRIIDKLLKSFRACDGDATLDRKSTWFSDMIVTSIPLVMPDEGPQLHGILYHELADLAMAQTEIFDQTGIFVRGAITVGKLIHNHDLIFGPAMIRAYELEQSTVFPRIAIDPDLLTRYSSGRELVAAHHVSHTVDSAYIDPLLWRDTNGVCSVNYIEECEHNFDDSRYYPVFMKKHRDAIVDGLQNKDSRIKEKYAWLAAYHNSVVTKHLNLGNDLLVKANV